MKILFHHRTLANDGQAVHIEELTSALRRDGHEVIVVGPPSHRRSGGHDGDKRIPVLRRVLPKAAYELMEFAYCVVAYRRLRTAYLEHRPDCLYERYNLFQPAGLWLKRAFALPMLLEVNAPLVYERSRFGGLALERLANWSERAVWRGADFVLPVTGVLARFVEDAGVPKERIAVIPNGINSDLLAHDPDPAAAKESLGLEGRLVLGFTGFVRDWHGLDAVIDLIADSDPALRLHLLLVGDGPARNDLERRAAARGVGARVTITGIVPRRDIARHVAAFDVALQPRVQPYASPLKLFEYMALSRAIVAPATENIREILRDGHDALLFDPELPGAFRAALERLCKDPELRRRLGTAARRTIEERDLTWDHNARRVVDLFRQVMDRRASDRIGG
ncbi:MAG: glycosyltransferase family 4 protein [Alphaproteobacteria bacterium]